MTRKAVLKGRFTKVKVAHLKERASDKSDARHIFYKAMFEHHTYEAYLSAVGDVKVYEPKFGSGKKPVSGFGEIQYVRRLGAVVDSQ
jgi:hypothetical protein